MNPLNKIMLGIGAAIMVIVAIVVIWLMIANAHLKTQLAQAQANATACHLANDEFAAKATLQNQAVAALQADTAAQEKRAVAIAAAGQKTAHAYAAAIAKLRAAPPRGDACAAAEHIIDDYLERGQ